MSQPRGQLAHPTARFAVALLAMASVHAGTDAITPGITLIWVTSPIQPNQTLMVQYGSDIPLKQVGNMFLHGWGRALHHRRAALIFVLLLRLVGPMTRVNCI